MSIDRLIQLEQRIAILKKRLEAAERMREAVKDDPELLDLLGDTPKSPKAIAKSNGGISAKRGRPKEPATRRIKGGPVAADHFKKIAEYLELGGNKPKGIPEIVVGTGLKAGNVIQVCYRTHGFLFERCAVQGHSTKVAWRLKNGWREIMKKDESEAIKG